jgi:hypothetical protein
MRGCILGLELLVDCMGGAGAIVIALPVLRDMGLRRALHILGRSRPIRGAEAAGPAVRARVEADRSTFDPMEPISIAWGLTLVAGSYGLHVITLLLHAGFD